ncbi:hypothetical protein ABB37_00127 [Leptomonas pyrrhocoris]|uniref:MORN repeat-containing protein 5 n=1 Tax=Leptomonas pyrrhocoris TaxID=157538 RepID=A0A0M9G9U8_LEPPY|nr:hypothetical protein ABB37_00127 [Leptomonas pyrrhocoris]KPA85773.1 hypothetical protein ABB37_00127 [Leptomonas pyrrhocoris]|eukprot:XP_015664212.1 hypothetical protein ABB37_00127 [Leptomonas pyrrhocoris]
MDFIPCSYIGQTTADGRRFDGLGRYTFANGDVYVGGMLDGQFHGQGVIFFRSTAYAGKFASAANANGGLTSASAPANEQGQKASAEEGLKGFLNQTDTAASPATPESWSGQYRGVWEHGRHVEGQYVFQDGLVFGNEGGDARRFSSAAWTYCHGSDRRLWEEYLENVAPVLPHEALLGGAKLLHERKHAAASSADGAPIAEEGEGLPLVLPNAFVQARAAPAFAAGQLSSVNDPRLARWNVAAAMTHEAAKTQKTVPTLSTSESAAASPEMVESTIALQLAVAQSTAGLRARDPFKDGGATRDVHSAGEANGALPPKLNLSVCRVKDVEDVNRELVQVVPAPS